MVGYENKLRSIFELCSAVNWIPDLKLKFLIYSTAFAWYTTCIDANAEWSRSRSNLGVNNAKVFLPAPWIVWIGNIGHGLIFIVYFSHQYLRGYCLHCYLQRIDNKKMSFHIFQIFQICSTTYQAGQTKKRKKVNWLWQIEF